jgi:benzil reductase ((S)-benzoin forming)
MNYYIITGTSKGLGEAIANQLIIEENNRVYCLSRSINENLLKKAKECHSIVEYFKLDITNINEVEEVVSRILQSIEMQPTDSITLINNAGVIEPITTVGNMLAEDLNVNVVTNLLAPMVITNVFLNKTEYVEAEKCIVNVSSGAANRAISGWSSYCSTKAGLDMFTKTVGLEQQQKQFPTTVISFSPGIMADNHS